MAKYSDLKQIVLQALYSPLETFPMLARVLPELERGNTAAYEIAATSGSIPANPCANSTAGLATDVNTLIKCADEFAGRKYLNFTQYRNYVDGLTEQSRFFAEVWPTNANGNIMEPKKTSSPLLLITASLDPVTPKSGAHRMSSVFPGSIVLTQNSTGHSAIASASSCLVENIQTYLSGRLPSKNTSCQPDAVPFQGLSSPIVI